MFSVPVLVIIVLLFQDDVVRMGKWVTFSSCFAGTQVRSFDIRFFLFIFIYHFKSCGSWINVYRFSPVQLRNGNYLCFNWNCWRVPRTLEIRCRHHWHLGINNIDIIDSISSVRGTQSHSVFGTATPCSMLSLDNISHWMPVTLVAAKQKRKQKIYEKLN